MFIEGPYSTPSRDILKSRHVILVAGGIGVTPFVSVLQSVLNMLKQTSEASAPCTCCDHKSGSRICRKQTKLEKVSFTDELESNSWVLRRQLIMCMYEFLKVLSVLLYNKL